MTKADLFPYLPNRWKIDDVKGKPPSRTRLVAEAHFIHGMPVQDACKKYGIHRNGVGGTLQAIRNKMQKDGWTHVVVTRHVYARTTGAPS